MSHAGCTTVRVERVRLRVVHAQALAAKVVLILELVDLLGLAVKIPFGSKICVLGERFFTSKCFPLVIVVLAPLRLSAFSTGRSRMF